MLLYCVCVCVCVCVFFYKLQYDDLHSQQEN